MSVATCGTRKDGLVWPTMVEPSLFQFPWHGGTWSPIGLLAGRSHPTRSPCGRAMTAQFAVILKPGGVANMYEDTHTQSRLPDPSSCVERK